MAESPAGRSYPPTEPYQVSRAKIAEFAAALADDNPWYHYPAPDGGEPLAPPTFAIVVASRAWEQLFGDAELGLALHRTIHGEQGFRWERPLRAGDEVTATLTIDRFRTRGGSDMVGTSVALKTTEGELVCTATATFVHAHEGAA